MVQCGVVNYYLHVALEVLAYYLSNSKLIKHFMTRGPFSVRYRAVESNRRVMRGNGQTFNPIERRQCQSDDITPRVDLA